jgi:hypothetical protein
MSIGSNAGLPAMGQATSKIVLRQKNNGSMLRGWKGITENQSSNRIALLFIPDLYLNVVANIKIPDNLFG